MRRLVTRKILPAAGLAMLLNELRGLLVAKALLLPVALALLAKIHG